MKADENKVTLRVGAALLLMQADEADRMNFLEDFDRIYGAERTAIETQKIRTQKSIDVQVQVLQTRIKSIEEELAKPR